MNNICQRLNQQPTTGSFHFLLSEKDFDNRYTFRVRICEKISENLIKNK